MNSKTIKSCGYGVEREVVLEVGKKYKVAPLNPRKKKNRDRECIITGFDEDFMPKKAFVIWYDNQKKGSEDVGDLIETQ